ncbi:MAG TPA: hypothetical protein VFM16_01795 [Holophagaceae bacterium]|nr:hypothetical protein [Holophagaceae bacterium]
MAKDKVIQVQKKAQSLEQFQKTAAGEGSPALKGVLIGAGLLVAGIVGWGAWSAHRDKADRAFEAQVAALQIQVEGDGSAAEAPGQLQARMQAALPKLEALVQSAPSSRRAQAQGLLATWKLELTGQGGPAASTDTPWGRLREAQRLTALGKGQEAASVLAPLRSKAKADTPWGQAFWASQLEADRLKGDRAQALKDLDTYRSLFKDTSDSAQLQRLVQSI